jgi:hypothetical protein
MRRRENTDEPADLVGALPETPISESKKDPPPKPPEETLASAKKPKPVVEAKAPEHVSPTDEPTPTWHYVAVLAVCVVAIMMAIYAARF